MEQVRACVRAWRRHSRGRQAVVYVWHHAPRLVVDLTYVLAGLLTPQHSPPRQPQPQVYISYGPKSNSDLLLLYGFCLDRNPFDSVEIKVRPCARSLSLSASFAAWPGRTHTCPTHTTPINSNHYHHHHHNPRCRCSPTTRSSSRSASSWPRWSGERSSPFPSTPTGARVHPPSPHPLELLIKASPVSPSHPNPQRTPGTPTSSSSTCASCT